MALVPRTVASQLAMLVVCSDEVTRHGSACGDHNLFIVYGIRNLLICGTDNACRLSHPLADMARGPQLAGVQGSS